MQLGAGVVRALRGDERRIALVASSSWSHAFLNDKDWHLRPDTAAAWRSTTPSLGMDLAWSTMVTTDVFNSNECFAIFEES
jgi:hypothetical protein